MRFRYVWPSEDSVMVVDDSIFFSVVSGKTKQLLILGIDTSTLLLVGGRIFSTLRRPTHLVFLQRSEDLAGFLTRQAVQKREKKRLGAQRANQGRKAAESATEFDSMFASFEMHRDYCDSLRR